MKRMHSIELFCSGEYDTNVHSFILDKDLQPGRYYFEYELTDDLIYTYCGFINIKIGDITTGCTSTAILNYDYDEPMFLYWEDTARNRIDMHYHGAEAPEQYDNQIITFYRIS